MAPTLAAHTLTGSERTEYGCLLADFATGAGVFFADCRRGSLTLGFRFSVLDDSTFFRTGILASTRPLPSQPPAPSPWYEARVRSDRRVGC